MENKLSIKELVERSKKAQEAFEFASQEEADAASRAVCKVLFDNAEMLAKLAAEETAMGSYEDKIAKCRNKSALIWHSLKGKKSVGIINEIEERKMIEIAKPMGVVASIVPSTNPTVTPMSNAAFALKTRNSIIFAPHPKAVQCTKVIVDLFRKELAKLGFPEDLVLGLEEVSVENSSELMSLSDIIVATGGMGMVRSAYSSGKPAYGVGAGNVQCIVDRDADLAEAAEKILIGRNFDHGLICLGEQTVFVPEEKLEDFIAEVEKRGGFYVSEAEKIQEIRENLFPNGGPINKELVGVTASAAAEKLGLDAPKEVKTIVVKVEKAGAGEVLCKEKMCPVISVITYPTFEEGVGMMMDNLNYEGKGHSIAIHSNTKEHVEYAALQCSVSRVIVNQPAGTTGGGSPTNGFTATTTLGCGSWGNNSFSGNLSYEHLMNITRIGYPFEESYLPSVEDAWL